MEKYDIEAYLEGSLSQEEQAEFEQELRRNPDFAHRVEIQRKATQLLRRHLLREQVNSVLKEKTVHRRTRRWIWVILGTLLILLAGYFFYLRKKQPGILPAHPEAATPDTIRINETPPVAAPEITSEQPTLEDKKAPEKPQPIAEGKPSELPLPAYPSPSVRGQGGNNAAWKTLLDRIWYTQLPPNAASFKARYTETVKSLSKRDFENAFVQLETLEGALPENDTLRLLKGYCLLEMGEGSDALRYFDQLEIKQQGWKTWLEWHRGLALLLSGDTKKAIPEFRKIAGSFNHPFRRQGQKALELVN